MRRVTRVAFVPRHLVCARRPGCSGARGVFPLRFARQRKSASPFSREPAKEGLGIVVAHDGHRMLVGLRESRIAPGEILPLHELRAVPAEATRRSALRFRSVTSLSLI